MATPDEIRDLTEKMRGEREMLLSQFAALTEEQALYVPENAVGEAQWTAKEQMAHLASMETSYRAWVERALSADAPDVSGVAGEAPAISMREAHDFPVAAHVAELRSQREKTLRLIESLSPEQYERRATNRLFGSLTVMQWLRSYYRHDRMHRDQVAGRDPEYKPRWAGGASEPDQRAR